MAVAPLFVADMNTLKAKLRLSGAASADALSIIDQAVEDVRVGLYDEGRGLGLTRVNELLAIAYTENATTAEDLERTRANSLEVKWVRLLLLRRMPTLFMDGSAITQEVWNEEPVTRNSRRDLEDEIARLEEEILSDLGELLDDEDEIGELDAIVFEPESTPDKPGMSIAPRWLSKPSWLGSED